MKGGLPGVSVVKSPPASTGDMVLINKQGFNFSGERNGSPLRYSCSPRNPMDKEPGGLYNP